MGCRLDWTPLVFRASPPRAQKLPQRERGGWVRAVCRRWVVRRGGGDCCLHLAAYFRATLARGRNSNFTFSGARSGLYPPGGPRSPIPGLGSLEAAHLAQYGTLAFLAFFSMRGRSLVARSAQILLLVAVGLVDELIQWALATRFAEVRDVAVNAAAGAFGLLYAGLVLDEGGVKRGELVWPTRAELRQVAISAALVLPLLGAFMYFVHWGHWIRWHDVEFVSQYHAEELENTGEERRMRWSSISPSERGGLLRPAEDLWGIEDSYVTEARRHIQARNQAADAGDVHAATGENQIVERRYSPYVEIAGARRTDLPKDITRAYRSNALAHLWPCLASPSVWGVLVVTEMALVGLVLRLGSTL